MNQPAPAKIQILVVDDDRDSLNIISQTILLMGHGCRTAINGLEAIEHLKEHFYQLVISDIRMPLMGGLELLDVIRCAFPMTAVILTSGYYDKYKQPEFIQAGAHDFIVKPFDLSELEDKITLLIKHRGV